MKRIVGQQLELVASKKIGIAEEYSPPRLFTGRQQLSGLAHVGILKPGGSLTIGSSHGVAAI
jgi:hypothetical protein